MRIAFRLIDASLLALALTILPVALAGCSLGGRTSGRQPAKQAGPNGSFAGAVFPQGLRAPDFTLTDQSGRSVSLADYRNRVRLLAFLSASKRGSLLVAQQIRGALDELEADSTRVATLIVSIDPTDTRARIERFLRAASLQGRAQYLTGQPAQLRRIWKAYGIVPASAGEAAFLSSTPILLVDRAGTERVGFPVEQLTPEGLEHDLRVLLSA